VAADAAARGADQELYQQMTIVGKADSADPAERLAREEYERAEKRRQELVEQRSELNPADVRVRTWERIHQLRMPSDPTHPILQVIATSTRLTLEEVREEQRLRALRATTHG
jgi:hypothetical protein